MLALKKKREAEAAKTKEEETQNNSNANETENTSSQGKVSLLGVGGKKTTDKSSASGTKKRSPGELRIQKGTDIDCRLEVLPLRNAVDNGIPVGIYRLNPAGSSISRWIDIHHSPHHVFLRTDIAELDGGKVAQIDFPNPNDLTNFTVTVSPDTGFWKGATYVFQFHVPEHYPHVPPKIICRTKIYHPNIDMEGKVCLNILREDWKPVLDINAVIYGLCYLFYEPNPNDPLNHEAAELFRKDVKQFERLVSRTLRGGILDGTHFERLV